jgi:hypothetical protein
MLEDLLIAAAGHGLTDRGRRLLAADPGLRARSSGIPSSWSARRSSACRHV